MKGVIAAGGLGTRLYPLTDITNKHLLPVYDKPMIYHPIETLVKAGIDEVAIIASGPHVGHFIRAIKNGAELGLRRIEYLYQENPSGGIADALAMAENFADEGNVTVILGDNCTDADISKEVKNFETGATIFLKEVPDPERFGIADINHEGDLMRIIEKPKNPKCNKAVTGLYIYDNTVWEKIASCKPSKRGQLEITDVNNLYIQDMRMNWAELKGFWRDAGTFDALYEVGSYWNLKKK